MIDDYRYFFIRGYSRSGTNWLKRLLGLHPRVRCTGGSTSSHEQQFVDRSRSPSVTCPWRPCATRPNRMSTRWSRPRSGLCRGRRPRRLVVREHSPVPCVPDADKDAASFLILGDAPRRLEQPDLPPAAAGNRRLRRRVRPAHREVHRFAFLKCHRDCSGRTARASQPTLGSCPDPSRAASRGPRCAGPASPGRPRGSTACGARLRCLTAGVKVFGAAAAGAPHQRELPSFAHASTPPSRTATFSLPSRQRAKARKAASRPPLS